MHFLKPPPSRLFSVFLAFLLIVPPAVLMTTAAAPAQTTATPGGGNDTSPVKGWSTEKPTPPPAAGDANVPPPPPPPPPPPAPPPAAEAPLAVYVAVDGTTTGPFDRQELAQKAASGELTGATLVWQEGMAEWQPAAEVPELAPILGAATGAAEPAQGGTGENGPAGWAPKTGPAPEPAQGATPAPEPSPGAVEQPAGFDPASFIIGTWDAAGVEVPIPDLGTNGILDGSITYQADGQLRLEGVLNVEMNGVPISITVVAEATYTVTRLSDSSFTVRPDGTLTMTVPGAPPESEPFDEPSSYVVLDDDTIRDTDGTVMTRRR